MREFEPVDGEPPATHEPEQAAYGCNQPCPTCKTYYVCTRDAAHDGAHWCEANHSF